MAKENKNQTNSKTISTVALVVSVFAILLSVYAVWNIHIFGNISFADYETVLRINEQSSNNTKDINLIKECLNSGTECNLDD